MINLTKYCFGIFLEQWIWEDDNIDRWEGTIAASERRILITHLFSKAWTKFCKDTGALWGYYEQTNFLVTETGKDHDKISPKYVKETGGYTLNESRRYFG